MGEIACADKLDTFDFGVACDFFDGHLFACGSAETAVNVQVGDYSDFGCILLARSLLVVVVWLHLKIYHNSEELK